MRRPAGVLLVAAAAALGSLTGALVLPDGSGPTTAVPATAPASAQPPTASSTSTPSATGSASGGSGVPSPEPDSPDPNEVQPVSRDNLLTVADLAAAGLDVAARRSDVRAELVVCTEYETLDDVAESGPPVQQFWDNGPSGSIGVSEQAVASRTEEEATQVAQRVLRRLEACQRAPAGHWVYGPTHSARIAPGVTASWLGQVGPSLNRTGRAPAGEQNNGAVAVLRNGSHVAVLTVNWCQGAGESAPCIRGPKDAEQQLVRLTEAAARRLG